MSKNNTYLVVTPFFPSMESFVGSYIFDQLNELRKQSDLNIEVVKVVSLFSDESDYVFMNFSVRIFKVIDFPFFIFPGLFNGINKTRFKFFLSQKGLKNIKFSHSHVSYPSLYLVQNLECKKIIQHHGLDALQLLNGRSKLISFIQSNFLIKNTIRHLNNADLNIGVSQLVLKELRKYICYNPKDEFVLYNGVDTQKFFSKLTNDNAYFSIGCVANFWKIKDQITLIKAVHLILKSGKMIKLRFIGSGPTLNACKRYVYVNNLSDYINFESEIVHNKLNDFYNNIDLFVLPSFYEALGCVYLEAWATGTPFIAIEDQGISELIPNNKKKDFLAIRESVVSLQEKILAAADSDVFPFDERYNIKNTISDFLNQSIFYEE